jgi:hypothetical protein
MNPLTLRDTVELSLVERRLATPLASECPGLFLPALDGVGESPDPNIMEHPSPYFELPHPYTTLAESEEGGRNAEVSPVTSPVPSATTTLGGHHSHLLLSKSDLRLGAFIPDYLLQVMPLPFNSGGGDCQHLYPWL